MVPWGGGAPLAAVGRSMEPIGGAFGKLNAELQDLLPAIAKLRVEVLRVTNGPGPAFPKLQYESVRPAGDPAKAFNYTGFIVAVNETTTALTRLKDSAVRFATAASPTGAKPLNDAFHLLAGTVGAVVLPGVVALSAGIMTVADLFSKDLEANAEAVADAWAKAIPVFVDVTNAVTRFAKRLIEAADNPAGVVSGMAGWAVGKAAGAGVGAVGVLAGAAGRLAAGDVAGVVGGAAGAAAGNGAAGAAQARNGETWKLFRENFGNIIKDMRGSLGGPGGYSSVEDARRRLQQASFQSPTEVKLFQMFERAIAILEKTEQKLPGPGAVR